MHRPTRLKVTDINEHFICVLCGGYLIDATTIVECLHSFCRTCIVQYLKDHKFCPVCDVQVHKTKPLCNIKSDVTLQDIVYKLIPGLYQNEMQKRREFYSGHPEAAAEVSSEERGEGAEQRCFYSPQETISLSLEYMHSSKDAAENNDNKGSSKKDPMTRYLNCPAALTVANLKKFIRQKFGVPPAFSIEIMYDESLLVDEYTLMDIAYIYTWRRAGPMKFLYSITTSPSRTNCEVLKVNPEVKDELTTVPSVLESEETDASTKAEEQKDSERMEIDELSNTTANAETASSDVEVKSNVVSPSLCSTSDVQPMEIVESETPVQNVNNTSPENLPVTSKVELLPQSIHILTAPQHTVIASANSLKMKFVADPNPKPRSKKSSGKKGGRGSRNKTVPVQHFARIAPYPKPATVPPTCLTATNLTPLSQLTVGKLVPNVITSPAPTLVTALVSTTANSFCSSSPNTTLQPPTQFLGQVTTCNVVTCNVTTFSNSFSSSNNFPQKHCVSSATDTKLTSSIPTSSFISAMPNSHVITIPTVQSPVNIVPNLPTIEVTTSSVNVKPPVPHISITNGSVSVPISLPATTCKVNQSECNSIITSQVNTLSNTVLSSAPSIPVISVLSDSSASTRESSQNGSIMPQNSSVSPVPNSTPPLSSAAVDDKTSDVSDKTVSSLQMLLTCDKPNDKKETANINDAAKADDTAIKSSESAKNSPSHNELTNGSCESFPSNNKSPEIIDKKEKNSISAEFSDNDDLGCQADLVVDEHKMDSSDNEDESDVALREKITAIAEKEDDADDTEADSGRASDMSNQARSSCDDDIGSPTPTSISEPDRKLTSITTTTANSVLPSFTLPVTSSSTTDTNNRSAKSNNINHVINNLYRNHEKKDNFGALDLSTSCVRKVGEAAGARPKPVANPVLDIKHKQPSYLGAASKQHTACPPPPKPPTSSILMQGLTSRTPLVPSQLHGKPPHIPVSTFLGPPSFFSSQTRAVSTSSCTTGRSTPTYNVSRTASSPVPISHSALSLLPVSTVSSQMMPGIPYPPCVPNPLAYPYRTPVTMPHHKGIASPPSTSNHGKTSSKQSNSRKSDSHNCKGLTSPNSRNGALGVASPATQASYPKTSPSNARMSPLASTAPSPKSMIPSSLPNTPSYKPSQSLSPKSIMPSTLPNTSSYKSSQSPIYKKSYKSYNTKFKGSNLTVLNPGDTDHNGYSPKLVIKNISVKHHHHQHHHSSPK